MQYSLAVLQTEFHTVQYIHSIAIFSGCPANTVPYGSIHTLYCNILWLSCKHSSILFNTYTLLQYSLAVLQTEFHTVQYTHSKTIAIFSGCPAHSVPYCSIHTLYCNILWLSCKQCSILFSTHTRPTYPKILLPVLRTAYVHIFRFLTGFFCGCTTNQSKRSSVKGQFFYHSSCKKTVCELTFSIIQTHSTQTT